MYNVTVDVQNCSAITGLVTTFTRGNKFFELVNQLGNALAVISDRELQVSLDGIFVGYYLPEIVMGNDYYPFGSLMPGRRFAVGGRGYRYGFNGQEKSDDVTVGNYTAEFWEYDSRIGRRWNLDPKPEPGNSQYLTFDNNPIVNMDVMGDTPRIYNNAQFTNTTLSDKGGTLDAVNRSIFFKDAQLVPALAASNNKLVGYHIFDTKNKSNSPVLQIEANDLKDFKENYNSLMYGARLFYSNGGSSEGVRKSSAGVESGNYVLAWQGVKQENKEFWSDPTRSIPAILGIMHTSIATSPLKNKINIKSPLYRSVGKIEVTVKDLEFLKILETNQSGTWVKVYEAAYLNGRQVEVHYFLHKQTGTFWDSKIKHESWSKQFKKGKNKIY